MTSKAVLCRALLEGHVLNVKNCFKEIGLTNIAREIPRLIEKPFQVIVSRTNKTGKNKYGESVAWVDYRLNHTLYNQDGIEKMKQYVKEHYHTLLTAMTEKELKFYKQLNLL